MNLYQRPGEMGFVVVHVVDGDGDHSPGVLRWGAVVAGHHHQRIRALPLPV